MATNQPLNSNTRFWHHIPGLPVQLSPVFDIPPKPFAVVKWLAGSWKPTSFYAIAAGVAALVYFSFHPSQSQMQTLSLGWIFQIWFRNALLLTLVAGSLHLYFYTFKKQNRDLKYERKFLNRNSKIHNFGNQVLDNMFWSLLSGVSIWTAYEATYFWASANGYVPQFHFADSPVLFLLMFPLITIWSSFHFYWIHRLLHWPPLYKVAHALHHRNVNIGPWSGISMHPIEHILYFSSFAIHFVIISHPVHFLFHAYFSGNRASGISQWLRRITGKWKKNAWNLEHFSTSCITNFTNATMVRLKCRGTDGLVRSITALKKRLLEYESAGGRFNRSATSSNSARAHLISKANLA